MAALAEAMFGGEKYLSVTFCVYFGWSDATMDGDGAHRLLQPSLGGNRLQTHHQQMFKYVTLGNGAKHDILIFQVKTE